MCNLAILLFIIYVVYFRPDGGSIQNAFKIIKGLNSNTFNYLENHKERLQLDKAIPVLTKITSSLVFFSTCVRLNRPCILEELAKNWPATLEWSNPIQEGD